MSLISDGRFGIDDGLEIAAWVGQRMTPRLVSLHDKIVLRTAASFARPAPFDLRPLPIDHPNRQGDRWVSMLSVGLWAHWEVPFIVGVEGLLSKLGFAFSRHYHYGSSQLFVREFQKVVAERPDIILLVPPPSDYLTDAFRRWVASVEVPIITIDQALGDYPCVGPDHVGGATMLADELLKDRPTHVITITGASNVVSSAGRLDGFKRSIERHSNLHCRFESVVLSELTAFHKQYSGVERLVDIIRGLDDVDGVGFLADCPSRAFLAYTITERLKDGWPQRWQIFHYDGIDEGELTKYASSSRGPHVAGCKVDRYEMAEQAANLVLQTVMDRSRPMGTRTRPILPKMHS